MTYIKPSLEETLQLAREAGYRAKSEALAIEAGGGYFGADESGARAPKEEALTRKPTKAEKAIAKSALRDLQNIKCRALYIQNTFGQVDAAFVSEAEKLSIQVEQMEGYIKSALENGWWEHFL